MDESDFWGTPQGKQFLRHWKWRKRKHRVRRFTERIFGWPRRSQWEKMFDDFSDVTKATGTLTEADLLAGIDALERRDRG